MTTVWVDADSCPRLVRDYLINYTKKLKIAIKFVANHIIPQTMEHPLYEMILCAQGEGAADDYIVRHSTQSDLVITRDIPLAARLVEKKTAVLNDRGAVYTNENIQKRLADRNFNLQLAQIGLTGSKKISFSQKELSAFAISFDKEIHLLLQKNI